MTTEASRKEPQVLNMEHVDGDDAMPQGASANCDDCKDSITSGWAHTERTDVGLLCDDCSVFTCDFCKMEWRGVSRTCSSCSDHFCDNCRTSNATECPSCVGPRPGPAAIAFDEALKKFTACRQLRRRVELSGVIGVVKPATMFVARMRAPTALDFIAIGETFQDAVAALAKGWEKHRGEYPESALPWEQASFHYGYAVTLTTVGGCLRDGQEISS